jgi:hypothetical protein
MKTISPQPAQRTLRIADPSGPNFGEARFSDVINKLYVSWVSYGI